MCTCCGVFIGTYVCTCCGVAPNFTMCTRFLFQPVLSQYDAKLFLWHCLFWGKRRRVGKGSEITGHCLGRPVDHHRMMLSLLITGWCCGCRWCCGFKRIGTRSVKLIWRFLRHCMYCQALPSKAAASLSLQDDVAETTSHAENILQTCQRSQGWWRLLIDFAGKT